MKSLESFNNLLTQTQNIRSDKYKVLTTSEILKPFTTSGFEIVKIDARRKRKNTIAENDHRHHVVRLRSNDFKIENDFIDIVISNSYDGSSPFKINLGIFRLVCSNGLVIGKSFFERSIKHVGDDFLHKVWAAIRDALNKKNELLELINKMKVLSLSEEQIVEFTRMQFANRLKSIPNLISFDASAKALRSEDVGNTAWLILNRVQEKLINGGIVYSYHPTLENGEVDRSRILVSKSRKITSPSEQLNVNKLVFDGAIKMLDLVTA